MFTNFRDPRTFGQTVARTDRQPENIMPAAPNWGGGKNRC